MSSSGCSVLTPCRLASILATVTDIATAEQRFGAEIRGWLTRLLGPTDACDAYANAMERATQHFCNVREQSDPGVRSWLFAIARNEAYRLLRKRVRARHHERRLQTEEKGTIVAPGPGPSTELRERDRQAQLKAGIDALMASLEPEESALLVLRFQEGQSYRDIAAALSTPKTPLFEATVRQRVCRLVRKLREQATHRGLEQLAIP